MLELKDICFERDGKKILDNVNLVSGKVQATNNMGGIIGYMETNGTGLDIDITIKKYQM